MAQPQLIAQLNTIALAIKDQLNNVLRVKSIRATGDVDFSGASGFKTPAIAFCVSSNSNEAVGAGAFFVGFSNEDYDLHNDFTLSTVGSGCYFTAPVDGVYHFDLRLQAAPGPENFVSILYVNGNDTREGQHWDVNGIAAGQSGGTIATNLSADVKLTTGDKIQAGVYSDDGFSRSGNPWQQYFTGHLVVAI